MPVLSARRTIGVGLSGCGDIAAKAHLPLFAAHGYALRAAYNPTPAKAATVVAAHGGDVAPDFEALLAREDVELVVIAAPPAVHAAQCCAALRAGKHMLCEKPSALSSAENRAILEAWRASGRALAFCSSRLRHGGYTAMAERYLAEGRLGRVYRVEIAFARPHHRPGIDWLEHAEWFTERARAGGGVLMDMGVYLLDQALHLLGWPRLQTIDAHCFQGFPHALPPARVVDVEEQVSLLARLEGGIALSLDCSACANLPPLHRLAILGDRGGIQIEHHPGGRGFSFCEEAPGMRGKLVEHKPQFSCEPWDSATLYRQLASHILDGAAAPGTTPEQALELGRWCELAYRSDTEGRELSARDFRGGLP